MADTAASTEPYALLLARTARERFGATWAVAESGAKNGMALVMEPDTGRVLALANYPSYNPNVRANLTGAQLRKIVLKRCRHLPLVVIRQV